MNTAGDDRRAGAGAEGTVAGLVARGLTRRFGPRTVVDGVDLDVPPGRLVGLLGPNGAGKTTVFRMLIGLLRPDQGEVRLDDRALTRASVDARARAGLGYLAQGASVFRGMSVRDNLLTALELHGVRGASARERAAALLDEFGLNERAGASADTLSGGERRRTEIARALCADPRVLILDEPFASVDPRMADEIASELRRLRDRGLGLLLTDHGARQLLPLCDRVIVLLDGVAVARGAPEEVVADVRVRERYLGPHFRL